MRKWFLGLAVFISTASMSASVAPPLFMRDVTVSPDGQYIAFEYKGDIYKVSTSGGDAVQLTTQPSYEAHPVWSHDSKTLAFVSDRYGDFDIFTMSAEGGAAHRITKNSTKEIPETFSLDDKSIYYSAHLQDPASSIQFPSSRLTELYKIPISGGISKQVMATPAERLSLAKDGKCFLYMDDKGTENYWRKHHTSSVTRDIWMYDIVNQKSHVLRAWKGEDRDPRFSPDNKTVYYLTEEFGSFNVASFPLDTPSKIQQITHFKKHPVRFLSIASTGLLCYTFDGSIYTQKSSVASPKKLSLRILRDEEPEIERLSITRGAEDAEVSSDGKMVALIKRGEVFVTAVDYSTTKQISHTPQAEKGLSFSPDGRTLAYATERNGNWQLVLATMPRREDPDFSHATIVNEEILLPSKTVERTSPQFSPDGKELAFIQNRKQLMVYNLKTKKVRQITDGHYRADTSGRVSYSWSPDGQWFAITYVGNQHDPYSDIGLVSSKGGEDIHNLTNCAYFDSSAHWVMDGQAILFSSNRYGMRNHASWGSEEDALLLFLNQDAYDEYRLSKEDFDLLKQLKAQQKKDKEKAEKKDKKKDSKKKEDKKDKKKVTKIDWVNMDSRLVRLTPHSSDLISTAIDKKGENLYFVSRFQNKYDLWTTNLREHSTSLLKKLGASWAQLDWDKSGKNLFIFGPSISKMTIATKSIKPIRYAGTMELDLSAERAYELEHIYLQEKKRFYDVHMHGVHWDDMVNDYRKFLPNINNNYDFAAMLSELLGELNVSHTGSGYFAPNNGDSTADLGLYFDWNYTAQGLRVSEVLAGGPFDRATSLVKPGVIVESIDGVSLKKGQDYYPLLNHKVGKRVLVGFYNPQASKEQKAHWEEVVRPLSKRNVAHLEYKRWVKREAAMVDKLSNGRLGYVHIEGMDDESFRRMYADVLGKFNQCEGIVIDTRFNGGGRLHEDVEVFFTGKKYLTQVIRGQEACAMPSRRWNKPSIMLVCEANYSNAHGTPWVYQHMGVGKVVGMPVPGTMTSVNWETLQDKSMYFGIPVIGYRQADGTYLENHQLEPDIKVANSPDVVVQGEDEQLEAAVKALLADIDAKK